MRQAGGSAATIYSSGGMPVQSAVLNSGTIPLLRGAFVPRDFGTAIEGVSLLRVPLLGTIDCIYIHSCIRTYIHTHQVYTYIRYRMTRMTGPDCVVMCNLINIPTNIHIYMYTSTISLWGQATREVGRDRFVAPFPFSGARIYVSAVWPWWDFMDYWWDSWVWVRCPRPSSACSGQQRSSKHGGAREQS